MAAMRNKDVQHMREILAKDLFERDHYTVDDNDISVLDEEVTTVIGGKKCTCIASSHGIRCICLMVAELVAQSDAAAGCENNVDNDEHSSSVTAEHTATTAADPSVDLTARQQIHEIQMWLENDSDAVNSHGRKSDIVKDLRNLHTLIFSKMFRKTTRKRKIAPNCSYRRSIDKAKKIKMASDHIYVSNMTNTTKKSKTMPDGSFKKLCRGVHGVRKPFL
jgi:hypothetical protein